MIKVKMSFNQPESRIQEAISYMECNLPKGVRVVNVSMVKCPKFKEYDIFLFYEEK